MEEGGGGGERESNEPRRKRERKGRGVVVVLVGLPGSGKSTFSNNLVQNGCHKWVRICQDIISNGRRGSKEQCLKHAGRALSDGYNVLIDRCNLSRDQRAEFVELAKRTDSEAHALVFELPIKSCIGRAMQRSGHEGGLEGKSAPAAVQRMAQKTESPCLNEGFSYVICCKSDNDIQEALNLYSNYNEEYDDISTYMDMYRLKEESKLIVLFLSGDHEKQKTIEANVIPLYPNRKTSTSEKGKIKNSGNNQKLKIGVEREGSLKLENSDRNKITSLDEGFKTLAFPSISTSDFQFDHERAATIMIEKVSKFLSKYDQLGLRLILVDLSEKSDMLTRVRKKALEQNLDSRRFSTFIGDITRLYSAGGLQCRFVANATNWRLKPGGGGVNAAIFKATGEEFEAETKKRANTLTPGSVLIVPVPHVSPLYKSEGVTHVIHVLGPNMNPSRPNYLEGNYKRGCEILASAYSCLFESFASEVQSMLQRERDSGSMQVFSGGCSSSRVESKHEGEKPLNAFQILMQNSKRVQGSDGGRNVKQKQMSLEKTPLEKMPLQKMSLEKTALEKLSLTDIKEGNALTRGGLDSQPGTHKMEEVGRNLVIGSGLSNSKEHLTSHGPSKNDGKAVKKWASWAESLRNVALDPENHKDVVLELTNNTVVMNDLYPKGRKHLLIVAREEGLDTISDLQRCHLTLLQEMQGLGQSWVSKLQKEDTSLVFRIGFHSVPSMRQLHMHVISQDFDSCHLKNKKHWNSFTTSFFLDSKDVIEELERRGSVKSLGDEESLFSTELRCHRCRSVHPNIPRLKTHINLCLAPFSSRMIEKGYLITS